MDIKPHPKQLKKKEGFSYWGELSDAKSIHQKKYEAE